MREKNLRIDSREFFKNNITKSRFLKAEAKLIHKENPKGKIL
jgi:hypothetical protein